MYDHHGTINNKHAASRGESASSGRCAKVGTLEKHEAHLAGRYQAI